MKDSKEIMDVFDFPKSRAPEEQAMIVARQLINRADRIAEEKKTSKIVELRKLLEIASLGARQTNPMMKPILSLKTTEILKNHDF